jgi:hypothetical protein
MTTTSNGHNDISGSSHAFNGRTRDAYDLGRTHAKAVLRAQFEATIEHARRMQITGPEREFHAGLRTGLEQAIASLDQAPAEREIRVVGLEDEDDGFSAIAACSTQEQALAWVRFLNTLPTGDASPVIVTVRLDAPNPALARTEQIYAVHVQPGETPGELTATHVSDVQTVWHADDLWLSVREVAGHYRVTGIFAVSAVEAEQQGIAAARAWLDRRPASEPPALSSHK